MGFQIETGTATGRGFSGVDANGLLAKFYTWVTKSYASGGPNWYMHDDQSALGTDPYVVVCNTSSPSVNDYDTSPTGEAPIFLQVGMVDADAGQIYIKAYMWWNNSTQTGYGQWSWQFLETYDSADFAYDFRGGNDATYGSQMILATRRGSTWNHAVVGEWEGNTDVLEAATAVGTLQSGVSAGSSVTLQLDTGEASNFTADKYYFIYDFDGHSWVNYVKVESVTPGSDQITVDNLNQDFPSGAVISSYAHRQYAMKRLDNDINGSAEQNIHLPYVDSYGSEGDYADSTPDHYGHANFDKDLVDVGTPDDEGYYYCVRPWVQTQHNRVLGRIRNIYRAEDASLAQMLDYRTIDSTDDWLLGSDPGSSSRGVFILNTEST